MQLSSKARKAVAAGLTLSTFMWGVSLFALPMVASAAAHGDGCLVNLSGTIWHVEGSMRHGFPSAEVFASHGYSFSAVVAGNSDDSALAVGPVMKYADGTLVKGPSDPLVYLVANGQKRGFVSGSVFTGLGYSFANIVTAAVNTFADLPMGANLESATERHTAGVLVNSSGTIWQMTATGRKGVPSMEVFNSFGYSFANVVAANSADLAAANEGVLTARAACSGGSSTPPPVTGSVTVSAGSMPAGVTLPAGANNVKVAEFSVNNGSSAELTVSGLVVHRSGVGNTSDIANAYIYDGSNRLTSGRTFNSSSNDASFTLSLKVPANSSKVLALNVSLAASPTTGATHAFSLESASAVSASAAASGSFPIKSNTFTISGTAAGTITLTKTGSISNPRVGDRAAKVAEFTLAATTEDAFLQSITLTQGGSMANSAISNFMLKQSGNKVATAFAINSNSRLVLVFSPEFKIDRGNSRIFELYGDINGRPADTIIFYVEESADLQARGGTFGVGMTSTVTAMDTTAEAHTLTLQGGQFTITWSGPSSRNISNSAQDVSLWEGSLYTANTVEVRNWRLRMQDTTAADPDLCDSTSSCMVQDVKVWDADRNIVIAGPKEFTAAANLQDATLVAADTVTLAAGSTTKIKITVDVKNTPASSTMTLLAGLAAFGSNDIKNVDSNTFLTPATDISPNAEVQGQTATVTASALTVSTAPSPADHTLVKGATNDATAFNFAAGSGADVKVTSVTVTGGVSDTDDNAYGAAGAADGSSTTLASLVLTVKLMDGTTQVGQSKSFSSGTATFDNLNWVVPASQTKKLTVVVVTNSAASLNGASDFLRISLEASSVTAVDPDGNSASQTGIPANSAEGAGDVVVTVSAAGTLNASLAPNPTNPTSSLLVAGSTDQVLAAYKFEAIDDSFYVKKFNLLPFVSGASSVGSNDRIATLKVRYKNEAGTTVTQSVGLSAATNQVDISNNPMFVPQNGSATMEVLGDLAQFTILDGTEDENIAFSLDSNNTSSLNQATGKGSNADANSWGSDVTGNQHNVYRTVLTASKSSNTPDGSNRSRSSSQNVASWTLKSSSNSNAFLRGSRKAIDGATTSWAANGVGAPATSATAVSGTSSISVTEDGASAVNDSWNFDFGASAGLTAYNRMSFYIRSSVAKAAVGDMGISVSSTADATDDATLNGLGTVDLNNSSLVTALVAATWTYQDYAVTTSSTSRFVTFNIKANADNSSVILVDDLRFYNDSATATVVGNLAAGATANGIAFDLKNSGGTVVAYGALSGSGAAGGAGMSGTVALVAGNDADVTAITTYSDIELTSAGATYDVVTNTNTLMGADTTANENLSVSILTGTVSSAGNFRWYDNSDTAGSNNLAGITVAAPTSTTIDFSNNY